MTRKPQAKSKRKQGGQPGNKNNLRHGFYSKAFTPQENKELDSATPGLLAEVNLIRVSLLKLQGELSFEPIMRTDNNGAQFRDAHYLEQINSMVAMTTNIATLLRSDFLLKGKESEHKTTVLEALEEMRIELGLPI